jgi:hypothetical protein
LAVDNRYSSACSSSGAVSSKPRSWLAAWVRALTAPVRATQHPDGLHDPAAGLGGGGGLAGQHRPWCARRWCWRQSAHSATSPTTAAALLVVEGHHDTAGQDVEVARGELVWLLATHQPHSQTSSYVVSP